MVDGFAGTALTVAIVTLVVRGDAAGRHAVRSDLARPVARRHRGHGRPASVRLRYVPHRGASCGAVIAVTIAILVVVALVRRRDAWSASPAVA